MTRKVRKYTKEFREEAIKLALKSPNVNKVANELGIPSGTLNTWIKQLKNISPTSPEPNVPIENINLLLEENRRLHKELTAVREEKEILKKAAAYFAQHQK